MRHGSFLTSAASPLGGSRRDERTGAISANFDDVELPATLEVLRFEMRVRYGVLERGFDDAAIGFEHVSGECAAMLEVPDGASGIAKPAVPVGMDYTEGAAHLGEGESELLSRAFRIDDMPEPVGAYLNGFSNSCETGGGLRHGMKYDHEKTVGALELRSWESERANREIRVALSFCLSYGSVRLWDGVADRQSRRRLDMRARSREHRAYSDTQKHRQNADQY